jgi:hypothetical protein
MYSRMIAVLALVLSAGSAAAQSSAGSRDTTPGRSVDRNKLSGPRFGFTVFTGDIAKLRQQIDREPLMTQFGWQFETQISPPGAESKALMEWVFLVGGVEQDELNLSLSWLAGWRTRDGIELGAGPAVSMNKDNTKPTTSMIVAVGVAPTVGGIQIPVHFAVALAKGGPRLTTLVGWKIH